MVSTIMLYSTQKASLFCQIKLSLNLSVTDFYFISFQSTAPPWLTTTYVHIYKCLLRSYSHAPPWHFYACGVDKKHTLATRGARSVAMWLYRRSMSLKSWKNLEDRLVYIVVLLLLLGHGVLVADVAVIATMDENHGLSSKQQ